MFSDLENSSCTHRGSPSSQDDNIANISMPSTFLDTPSRLADSSYLSTPNSKICDLSTSMNWSVNSLPDVPHSEFVRHDTRISSLSSEIQLFRRLSQDVNHSRMRYNRTFLVINLLNELFTEGTELPADLKNKCLEKLQDFQLNNFLKRNPDLQNAVDVDIPVTKVKMTVHEQDLLRSVMKSLVAVKCSKLKIENEFISSLMTNQGSRISLPGSILSEEEGIVLDRVSDTAQLIEQCSENVKSIMDLNNELCDVRETKFRELHKAEIESLTSKTKLISLQIRNLNYMIEDAFVQQFDKMTEALNVLHKELQTSLHEAEYVLQKTKALKSKYELIRGHKFDEILEEYIQLRDNYKHKSWALKQITSSNNNNNDK